MTAGANAGSLRARLFAFLLGLAALSALAVGGATYWSVHAEADALFDYQLQQMALSLRDQGRINDDERAALANPEFDYAVQVWSLDGVSIYSSRPQGLRAPLPPRAVLGFSDVDLDGERWRVFGAATPLRVVQVAQPLAVRRELAAGAAARAVLPIALAAPLVALALWALLSWSLAPLGRVAAEARARAGSPRPAPSLAPLPQAGLPDEIKPLVSAFNDLLARLQGAFDAQRDFVADAAHELRTPLTALKLQIGLLRGAGDGADRDAALKRLSAGVDRAAHLVEQLLALARAEPGATADATHGPPLDLADLLRQGVADAMPMARQRGATLTLDAPAACPLPGDAQSLNSLVRNLIDNALKYGGAPPQVQIRLQQPPEGGALLWVDDTGPGIPEAERERVFDRFHRREDATASAPGSGLGLAIVRAVAERHGAQVTLHDAPLGGLRVQVRFAPA